MKQILRILVLSIVCRKSVIHQYLQNLAYVSLRIYCKAKFQSLFVKCLPKQTCLSSAIQAQVSLSLVGCGFPADGALAYGETGQVLGCPTAVWHFQDEVFVQILFGRLGNLNLSACVTCPGAKPGLNLGCLEKFPLQLSV